jgi:hypothetical protein
MEQSSVRTLSLEDLLSEIRALQTTETELLRQVVELSKEVAKLRGELNQLPGMQVWGSRPTWTPAPNPWPGGIQYTLAC